ncbi:MAG: hypothetical protein U5L95_04550 [Candidatus Saccharibacteria bacterium]|nr:hypothetical protein [Candidatus Saccharibacteria bacterium]
MPENDDNQQADQEPIDDVKPRAPDAASNGAEFSDDLGSQPFPPKDSTQSSQNAQESQNQEGVDQRPKVARQPVTPPPDGSAETERAAPPPSSEPPTTDPLPKVTSDVPTGTSSEKEPPAKAGKDAPQKSQDHGTHHSSTKSTRHVGLAIFIGLVGAALCGFVVFVYITTN